MKQKRVGLIGCGAIGQAIVKSWAEAAVDGHSLAAILVRHRQLKEVRAMAPANTLVTGDRFEFLTQDLQVAVEVAGHAAVQDLGVEVLARGIDLMLLSVGSLADEASLARLRHASEQGGGRLRLPVGAIAGLDGLLALRRAGLTTVKYTSIKPPLSWQGTVAERQFDLAAIEQPTVIFSGIARDAAAQYPRNANLAAAVALAGLGLDGTEVELIADPHVQGNIGRIDAHSRYSSMSVEVSGQASASNPKTSDITGMSVLSSLANGESVVSFV